MGYWLGIDIGTTATAAAVRRDDGTTAVVTLGDHGNVVPSAAFLQADGAYVFGEGALRRGLDEPERIARHFKRRIGDPVPLLLGRSPVPAQLLHARLLRSVVERVGAQEGSWPEAVVVTHPANWSTFKVDLVRSAAEQASVNVAGFVPEPVAAALAYSADRTLAAGAHVAVYDLGGGTFDACVLRARGDGGFDLVGPPVGVDQLGGIDFDEAVLAHVRAHLDGAVEALGDGDAVAQAALVALRRECTAAKEALSTDTEVTIPVLLPTVSTTVRLTRYELEEAIRPAIAETILALHRAIDGAGLTPDRLDAVLLVGGSSRIPLVGQLVGAALGLPVIVDAHPKDVVALGAARVAAGALGRSTATPAAATDAWTTGTVTALAPVTAVATVDDGAPAIAVDGAGGGRSWWVPALAVVVAIVVLGAAFLVLGGDDDGGEAASGDETTTTTTTTGEDDGGGTDDPSTLRPADFAAAGIDEFGPEAEAMWVPSCTDAAADTTGFALLEERQVEDVCRCTYDESSTQYDDLSTFLEHWYDEEQLNEPLRGIITSCTLEQGFG